MNVDYYLAVLVFSPLVGMALLTLMPKKNEISIKLAGILFTIPALVLSVLAFFHFRNGFHLELFHLKLDWIQLGNPEQVGDHFSIPFELGVDGFSLTMLVLTSVLSTLAAIASWNIQRECKGYFQLFLLLELGMLGVFTAENVILFFIFFELTLVPTFFLIGKWGYFEKEKAAYSFLLYNGIGSAILLIVILVLFARTGTVNIKELQALLSMADIQMIAPISEALKFGLLIALLIAFGIKLPIFPLHRWMVRVHVEAPPAIVMLHAGILLKIGAYGLIRFGMGIFPEQFKELAPIIAILGVVNLLYGALLAFIQTDFKKVLAYSSISHMGIVLMGIGALNEAGIQGAIFQVVSHGLIAALLFFLVGVQYERIQSTNMEKLSGLAKTFPIISGFFLFGAMASLGLPGLSGFVSEFMAFLGLFKELPVLAAIGTLGIILTAAYLLRAIMGMTFGPSEQVYKGKNDMQSLEFLPAVLLTTIIVAIGVYPSILSESVHTTIKTIMGQIGG